MKIELDPLDLKSEFQIDTPNGKDQACSTSDVDFDKLKPEIQAVVRAAGQAIFYAFDRATYSTIFPPRE